MYLNAIIKKYKLLSFCLLFSVLCSLYSADAQARSIVLRIRGKNPSKEETQQIAIKVYLPKEVRPGDILDKETGIARAEI